ncbi:MAG: hypothetical protein ACR2JF_07870 [Iamia sp.]
MARQLNLIPPSADDGWRLDDATIESGRRGLAKARAALAQAQARLATDRDHQTAA